MSEAGAVRGAWGVRLERLEAAGGESEGSRTGHADQCEGSASRRSRERNYRVGERAGASRKRRFAIMYCCGMLKRFCAA